VIVEIDFGIVLMLLLFYAGGVEDPNLGEIMQKVQVVLEPKGVLFNI
jgi:hypothetical protein